MGWDDENYDDLRRRRRREHDDDYDLHASPSGSGLVTLVGVLSIVWGTLVLLAALFFILIAFIAMANGRGRDREISIIVLAISMVGLLLGGLYLTGGIGLFGRRNWARVMTLILAAMNFLSAAAGLLGLVAALADRPRRDELIILLMFSCIGIVLNVGYGLLVYLTLLRANIAAEFR